jgi:biotin carboxyl carrier protein
MAEEIKAPLAGKVLHIMVETGEAVEADDEVLILEALKMETSVYASAGGTVKAIKVRAGDSVEEDDLLMVLE